MPGEVDVPEEAVEAAVYAWGHANVDAGVRFPVPQRMTIALKAAAPSIRSQERQRVRELAEQLQSWARNKRREAPKFVGDAEKLKAEWIAKGYDNSADLLLAALDSLEDK